MKQTTRHIILLLTFSLLLAVTVAAQRISFGLYAADDIVLTQLNSGELNFNLKQAVILAGGDPVNVNLLDDGVGILTVKGRTDMDITVTIDAPATLDLGSNHILLTKVKFAYSNTKASSDDAAKLTAIEIPDGFTSATFPIDRTIRHIAGLPAPPPTPNHVGYTALTGIAYLFVYGTLGKVPSGAAAGLYTGTINIRVEYAK